MVSRVWMPVRVSCPYLLQWWCINDNSTDRLLLIGWCIN